LTVKITQKINISKIFASWFGAGYLPIMPGTWGSIAALLMAFGFLDMGREYLCSVFFIIALVLTLIGVWVCTICYRDYEDHSTSSCHSSFDPGWIVIDEVAGYFWAVAVASVLRPVSLTSLVVTFAFFRFFDIKKIGPVGWIENYYGKNRETIPLGIMADDVVAGILAGLFTLIVIY
jgi:phosphatidylglycerophosphatase A